MSRQVRFTSEDMKTILATAVELQAIGGVPARRTIHLLTTLCSLVGGRIAIGGVARSARGRLTPVALLYAGFTHQPPAELDRYLAQLAPPNPVVPPMLARLRRGGRLTTELRRTLVPDRTWNQSEHVRTVRTPAGLGDAIFSACRLRDSDLVTVISVNRALTDRTRFTERERVLIHLLHGHVSPILVQTGQAPQRTPRLAQYNGVALTPRQKLTLEYLLDGASEKEIATRLSRSHHTVHVHVKGIYRAFGVTSRAELLAIFVGRNRPGISEAGND